MATDNNRTKTPNDAVKITELPEGSQLLLVDSSGVVLERMEAERFMELLRASIQIGGRNLIKNSEQFSFKSADNNFYFRPIGEALKVKAGDLFTASFGAVELTGSDSQRFQVSIYDDQKNLPSQNSSSVRMQRQSPQRSRPTVTTQKYYSIRAFRVIPQIRVSM